jgi:hypothetical protein
MFIVAGISGENLGFGEPDTEIWLHKLKNEACGLFERTYRSQGDLGVWLRVYRSRTNPSLRTTASISNRKRAQS